jgi:excisionase family DNA binding protein
MEPIFVTIKEACEMSRIGRTALYEAINSGALPARKHGSRTLILVNDLKKYAQSLPKVKPEREDGEAA